MIFKHCMKPLAFKLHIDKVNSNPGFTLPIFGHGQILQRRNLGKRVNNGTSEFIASYDLKCGKHRKLIEFMKFYE